MDLPKTYEHASTESHNRYTKKGYENEKLKKPKKKSAKKKKRKLGGEGGEKKIGYHCTSVRGVYVYFRSTRFFLPIDKKHSRNRRMKKSDDRE